MVQESLSLRQLSAIPPRWLLEERRKGIDYPFCTTCWPESGGNLEEDATGSDSVCGTELPLRSTDGRCWVLWHCAVAVEIESVVEFPKNKGFWQLEAHNASICTNNLIRHRWAIAALFYWLKKRSTDKCLFFRGRDLEPHESS